MSKTTAYTDGSGEELIEEIWRVQNALHEAQRDIQKALDEVRRLNRRITDLINQNGLHEDHN